MLLLFLNVTTMQSAYSLRQPAVQTVKRTWPFWFHLGFTLLFGLATIAAVIGGIRAQAPYPNLNVITIVGTGGTVLTLMFTWSQVGQTAFIQLLPDSFVGRKRWQRAAEHPYTSVTGHNVRLNFDRNQHWTELTVYLTDDWFALRSVDFPNFDELVAYFSSVSPAVRYRPVLSPAEQRLAQWFLIGALLVGTGPVWFGFAAHQSVSKQPARLVNLVGYVFDIRQTSNRNNAFTGYDLTLVNYPDFTFHVRKTSFSDSLRTVPDWFTTSGTTTLLIREHDFLTKINRKQSLTFGDKYDGYQTITVFGIGDRSGVRLRANQPAYDDPHTKPYIRLAVFMLYGIVIWSFWLAVDRQTI
ncbi:hypothetical protein [Spirosoma rhododendri]|uniref:Uncharacterized protein n=1 Tax=Spirosoma rhododendri TaxID=2728024 RepID=A0A7L5DSB1_9BACT|nr:hypothetical protein [Spirosoma rhododendri]QJD79448.1 hypothetical protein HH216_14305 [Spirosoma rhododendri]